MASFKDGALILEEKATYVTPGTDRVSLRVDANGTIYKFDGTNDVPLIEGGLNSTLNNYTLLSTTASISGSLEASKQNNITLVAGSNVSIVESPTDTWTISASVSGGSATSLVYAHYVSTAGQTIASGATATLLYATKITDTNNAATTGASDWYYTCPSAGKYLIDVRQSFTANADTWNGGAYILYVDTHGYVKDLDLGSAPSKLGKHFAGSVVYDFAANAVIRIKFSNGNDRTITRYTDSLRSYIKITRLGT